MKRRRSVDLIARTSQFYHLYTPLGPWIALLEMIDETYSHRHPPDPGLWIAWVEMIDETYSHRHPPDP